MSQSLSWDVVHGVFSTKNRVQNLKPEIHPELFAYLAAILNDEGHTAVKVGGHIDHVHMLFGLSRTMTIAKTIEKVKVSPSIWMKTKSSDLEGFSWQQGYGIFSVSESDVASVVSYIHKQAEHHATVSFQDEFRALMKEHGIPIDERYVWE